MKKHYTKPSMTERDLRELRYKLQPGFTEARMLLTRDAGIIIAELLPSCDSGEMQAMLDGLNAKEKK